MRVWLGALFVVTLAACALQRDEGLGTPCEDDDDCPRDFFCGADPDEVDRDPRICVPEAECDPGAFDVACAGPGFYSCVDDEVHFTECDSGDCLRGECVE